MFMFRSRKTNLVKRAWKARKICLPQSSDQQQQQLQRQAEQELKGHAMQQLRSLTESQLELLVTSLESGGAEIGECVLVPRDGDGGGGRVESNGTLSPAGDRQRQQQQLGGGVGERQLPVPPPPHLLMLSLWRWPHLFQSHPTPNHHHQPHHAYDEVADGGATLIRSLPWCAARNDHVYVCANPYHYATVTEIESPPPPYSRFNVDLLRPEDAAPSEGSFESLETGGTYQYYSYSNNGPGTDPWCQIAYWEGSARVGHMYPVRTPSLKIIGNIPHEEGLCLASLTSGPNYTPTEQSRKTKEKIGLGLVLYQEGGSVWVYNRSTIPMFVNSPNMDGGIHSRFNFNVHKLLPGHVINIFDYDRARLYQRLPLNPELMHEGPIDQNSVRLSFAKGWGRNYQRQEITQCPCWLEILLVVPVR